MVNKNHLAFKKKADPFYNIIMDGLEGKVEGPHFWDVVAEDAVFEFRYQFPGFATKIEGRKAYMDWFGSYPSSCCRSA
jgi:ketosteroid isomerase-like protein